MPLQRLADPLPATRLVVYCPHQEGLRRVGQLGDDTGQLAVKVVRSVLLVMRSAPGDHHEGAVSAGQPDRYVSVIVQVDARDVPWRTISVPSSFAIHTSVASKSASSGSLFTIHYSGLASMSRRRTPGSRATHGGTRAWLDSKI